MLKQKKQHKLIEARKRKNITQQELADYLGLSKSTVCLMELGLRRIPVDRAKKICEFLGEPMQKIFG
jgi:DNA-binding XRE family transcriptional regulator